MVSKDLKKRIKDSSCPEPNSGCWLWTGCVREDGLGYYPRMMVDYYPTYAHRVSYSAFIGDIPPGMGVLHRCDTPCCVNPAHLFLGTQQDNMTDRQKKGRTPSGKTHYKTKITESITAEISDLLKSGMSMRKVANNYGLKSTISVWKISKNRHWTQY